ncbi:hypothetical protein [Halarchaeum acidiphilum]|uniref:hypothetical protein n=1 Tax=Halarchaeum acidiphilum TaxID=489138 RepID=UPI00036F8DEB|nr:hypothetical protein [Halarchaeum acidiphilum]
MTRAEPIEFEEDEGTVRIHDRVMDTACRVTADGSIDPVRVSSARFLFPVDAAVAFETSSLSMPANAGACVRTEQGDIERQLTEERVSFPRGRTTSTSRRTARST